MLSNKHIELYISTISDDPRLVFEHLAIFEKLEMNGLHFDVMDGKFVPRLGLYPELLTSINSISSLPIEVHLMLEEPNKYIPIFIKSGAHRVLVHYEALTNPSTTFKLIKDFGAESCIVLNPETDFRHITPILNDVDFIMLMGINPGIPRHPFIPIIFEKLTSLRSWLDEEKPEVKIGIDGGVTFENAKHLHNIGADWLICGSGTIFKSGHSVADNIKKLKEVFTNSASSSVFPNNK
jgi:ribulose-phosphate 3-epimerase